MANPLQALDENFFYNSMLARALVALTPDQEREVIRIWLEKLHDMSESGDEKTIRNEYMWFLLLQLQNKRITIPFKKHPPHSELRPLKDILPAHIYEEVLTTTDQNMTWLDNMGEDGTLGGPPGLGKRSGETLEGREVPSSHPAMFLTNQPLPKDGIICYLAAFSDQDY